jgi:hypothetical protein
MPNILLPLLDIVARRYKARFLRAVRQTDRVQEEFLLTLLRRYRHTELGRKLDLESITSVEDFRDRVPIWPYSQYEPFIERIWQGESNVLTPDPVVYFNLTSGSTSKQKLIPITRRFQHSLQKANLASIGFLSDALRARGQKLGRLLLTNSAQILGRSPAGIPYGPASVGVLRMGKWVYEQLFANPFETLQVEDSTARHYVCLLFALRDRQLAGIAANFPMLVLRTCHYLERYAEDLLQDIETGTLANWLPLEPEQRGQLQRRWSGDPQRAAELRQLMQSEGRLTPKVAWPQLAYVATARGGTSDFYFERFSEYFGETPVFGGAYSSAEATFSIYPDVDTDGSVLAVDCGFFEFVPPDQWEAEQPHTLLASEVKLGVQYRLLVTSYAGLYRYDIGDVVEVVGFYEKVPLIVFQHRRGGLLSATTEKTTEFHVTQVMQALQREFNLSFEDFCITLSDREIPAHYLVNIEFNRDAAAIDLHALVQRFDEILQDIHTSYAVKRPDPIPAPRLRVLAPGSFATLRQRELERGIPDSQLKFPHVSEDRQFLAGLTVEREVRI